MIKTKLLMEVTLKYQQGCKITTNERFNDKVMYGDYIFDTLEEYVDFFDTEYDDMLVRKVHNTQILSWEFVYEIDR
jgi:hypothetical protein